MKVLINTSHGEMILVGKRLTDKMPKAHNVQTVRHFMMLSMKTAEVSRQFVNVHHAINQAQPL